MPFSIPIVLCAILVFLFHPHRGGYHGRIGIVGSPLGTRLSELVYTQSDTSWHKGISEEMEFSQRVHVDNDGQDIHVIPMKKSIDILLNEGPRHYLSFQQLPFASCTHSPDPSKEIEVSRIKGIVTLMMLAFRLNPHNLSPIFDAAFLSKEYTNSPLAYHEFLCILESQASQCTVNQQAEIWKILFLYAWYDKDSERSHTAYQKLLFIHPDNEKADNDRRALIHLYEFHSKNHFTKP